MVPNVAQQLQAIRHTIAKTIVPSLDPDAGFAQEQAGLILASLDWVLDVQASEHRYELVEHQDAIALLRGLTSLPAADAELTASAADLIAASAAVPADLLILRAQTLQLKQLAERVFTSLAETAEAAAAAALVAGSARRQSERELAWGRMTGFPKNVKGDIAAVLDQQAG